MICIEDKKLPARARPPVIRLAAKSPSEMRVVKPQEWLEKLLAHRRRNARSVIVRRYGEPAMVAMVGVGTVDANRAALKTRLARQRLNAAATPRLSVRLSPRNSVE